MTKGLVLKILGITAVAGGLVFANQLVSARTTHTTTATNAAAPLAPAAPAVQPPAPQEPSDQAAPADRPMLRRLRALRQHANQAPGGGGVNFVSVCRYSHTNQDDPIVYPGVAGATHHHDFFGNTTTDANSNLASLRAGGTTCRIAGDTAAYWAPSLFVNGQVVQPVLARIYYLPGRKDHTTVRPFPAGLEVLAKGDNVVVRWSCVGRGGDRTQAQDTPPTCPQGTHLVEHIRFPDCWDGRNLDTPDHVSNMAFATGGGCPASHPVPVPAILLNIHYPTQGGGTLALGFPDKPVAAHADFFNAWNQPTLDRLVRECIDAGMHCGANPPV
jgi:hypothetical protein